MPAPALIWTAETDDLLIASMGGVAGRRPIYVVVEMMADGGWDWAVWSNHGSQASHEGVELNRTRAMRQAELAAWTIRTVAKVVAA